MSNIYGIARDGSDWIVTQKCNETGIARPLIKTASLDDALRQLNHLKFQGRHNNEKPMRRCRGCKGNLIQDWNDDDYCDGCKEDYRFMDQRRLGDCLDYETEDSDDDED